MSGLGVRRGKRIWAGTNAPMPREALPAVLHWFTGRIGYHHIHHLRPRFPNHYLREIYESTPALQDVTTVDLRSILESLRMRVFDEQAGRMVGFGALAIK